MTLLGAIVLKIVRFKEGLFLLDRFYIYRNLVLTID